MGGATGRGHSILRGPLMTSPSAVCQPAASSGQLVSQQAVLSGSGYHGDSMSAPLRVGWRVVGVNWEPDVSPALMGLSILLRSKGSLARRVTHGDLQRTSAHTHTHTQQV